MDDFTRGLASFGVPLMGAADPPFVGRRLSSADAGTIWWVDGTNGSDNNRGDNATYPLGAIDSAVNKCLPGDIIRVFPKRMAMTDTDPGSYAETVTLDVPQVCIEGVSRGRSQGGLPQMKIGAGSTAMVTVQAPGCQILKMGFNGASSTGGGILLDDDGGTTTSAFGLEIAYCHFKNCKGHATNGTLGGGITWSTDGGGWQTWFHHNRFYKNVCDICLIGTSGSVPQDVVIEDSVFSSPVLSVDVNLYLKGGGSGIAGLVIRRCSFPQGIPNITSGTVKRYVDLTGCVGTIEDCRFGLIVSNTGSEGTFAATGTAAFIPATVFIVGCRGETTTVNEMGEIYRA